MVQHEMTDVLYLRADIERESSAFVAYLYDSVPVQEGVSWLVTRSIMHQR